jgi:hypothetical protein
MSHYLMSNCNYCVLYAKITPHIVHCDGWNHTIYLIQVLWIVVFCMTTTIFSCCGNHKRGLWKSKHINKSWKFKFLNWRQLNPLLKHRWREQVTLSENWQHWYNQKNNNKAMQTQYYQGGQNTKKKKGIQWPFCFGPIHHWIVDMQ